jgi:hypothetical protein
LWVRIAATKEYRLSEYAFLNPKSVYPLPKAFDFREYIETERELWAFFPETYGRRVNFCQLGLTALVYMETHDDASELKGGETYLLMPCADLTLRPIRMRPCRRMTLAEFRTTHLTTLKLAGRLSHAANIMHEIDLHILGPEIMEEVERLGD